MKLYKNIDVVQINIKEGVQEYYLPKNVDWSNKVIEKIIAYGAGHDMEEFSPIDYVTPILSRESLSNVYFDLYADDERELVHNLNAQNILYTNNNPVEINSKLSLQLSRIFFAEASPVDGCILLYVFYDNKDVENYDHPQKSVTVEFEIGGGQEVVLSDIIDTYIHAQGNRLKGIAHWGGPEYGNGYFLTLRNRNYKTIVNKLPLNMCRPPMGSDYMYAGGDVVAESVQINPMYFDNEDVDFANSTIQNTWNKGIRLLKHQITFLY